MSQSPITITLTLEEVLKQINQKLDNLQKDVTDLKIEQVKLSEKMDGLSKRIDDQEFTMSKRIDNQEFTNRGILIALVVAILGSAVKLLGWIGNP